MMSIADDDAELLEDQYGEMNFEQEQEDKIDPPDINEPAPYIPIQRIAKTMLKMKVLSMSPTLK